MSRILHESAETRKLDHPVWYALSEAHRHVALDYGEIKFYHPEYCPFGDFLTSGPMQKGLEQYARESGSFYLFDEPIELGNHLRVDSTLDCRQMILSERVHWEINEEIVELGPGHDRELADLVNLVQPGYFRTRTAELGRYYGIFCGDKLVAASGERMQMNDFTEVSAVVTHPEFIRRGYASQLITHTVHHILEDGKVPFLHVAATNTGAIRLYEKLGFRVRTTIRLWHLSRVNMG